MPILFFLSGALLSFAPLGLEWKLWIGLFGILLPLGLAASQARPGGGPLPWKEEWPLRFPFWFLGLAASAAALGRFTDFLYPGVFPNGDEALMQSGALELLRHWRWHLFFTTSQSPPGLVWAEYLLGRLGIGPPVSLWLPPALLSTLTVALGWAACRFYFSRSFTGTFTGLLAFSYWGFFLGRFSTLPVWLPFWMFLVLILWGLRRRSTGAIGRGSLTLLTGFVLGLGWMTFTSWPLVALFLAATFAWTLAAEKKGTAALSLAAGLGLGLLPFLLAAAREGYGQHISSIALWGGLVPAAKILPNLLSNVTVLFWGCFVPDATYIPGRGGFLDPLSAAFFFTGLIAAWRRRGEPLIRWMAGALVFFALPGLLAAGVESSRLAQELPVLLFFSALGLHAFLSGLPVGWRSAILGLLIALTGALNLGRLAAFPEGRPPVSPREDAQRQWLYHILKARADQAGPGWIFTHLEDTAIHNPSLSVMVYPFNAAENPGLSPDGDFPGKASWVGLVLDPGEVPFLSERFPEGKWAWSAPPDGSRRAVGIIPVDGKDRAALARWWRAYPFFQASDREFAFTDHPPYSRAIQGLEAGYARISGDPFLETRFWDKRAELEYQDRDLPEHLRSYRMGLARGDRTRELYLKYGMLLQTLGRFPEARRAYQAAARAPRPGR